MTTSWDNLHAWYEAKQPGQDSAEASLETAHAGGVEVEYPIIRLDCPRGHRVCWIGVELDHNWRPSLVFHADAAGLTFNPTDRMGRPVISAAELRAADRYVPDPAEPADDEPEHHGYIRWQIRCPKPRCSYTGAHDAARITALYSLGVYRGRPSVKLPT